MDIFKKESDQNTSNSGGIVRSLINAMERAAGTEETTPAGEEGSNQ
jgi:hypothetical protein